MYGNFVHATNDASHYTKPPTSEPRPPPPLFPCQATLSYPGHDGRLRFLEEIPEPAARPNDSSGTAMFVLDQRLTQRLRLSPDVLVHAISTLRVAVLAARLDVQLVHAPVVQVITLLFGT